MIVLQVLCVIFGVVVVFLVLSAAVRTVVVPRDEQVFLNRLVFRITRVCFEMFAKESRPYKDRDRVMARYAPTSLMLLPLVWITGVIGGFSAIFWGLHARPYSHALVLAGSSATTLGFERSDGLTVHLLVIVEAMIGLGLVAYWPVGRPLASVPASVRQSAPVIPCRLLTWPKPKEPLPLCAVVFGFHLLPKLNRNRNASSKPELNWGLP